LRFDPGTGASEFYAMPAPLARPTAATVDAHGNVYVTGGDRNVVGRIDAHRNVYVVAQEDSPAPITVVGGGLAVSADGALYVSDYSKGRVGRVEGSHFQWTDLGGDAHAPSNMVAAPDGSVWFVDLGFPSQVGRIDAAGTLQTFALPAEFQRPDAKSYSSIAVAPNGDVWFTYVETSKVVRVTPAGEVSYVSLEEQSLPRGLAIDAKGRVWLTTTGVARIDLGS
jgi:streptogramin lyase